MRAGLVVPQVRELPGSATVGLGEAMYPARGKQPSGGLLGSQHRCCEAEKDEREDLSP